MKGDHAILKSEVKIDAVVSTCAGDSDNIKKVSVEENKTKSEPIEEGHTNSESAMETRDCVENRTSETVLQNKRLIQNENTDSNLNVKSTNDLKVLAEEGNLNGEEKPLEGSGFCYGEKEKERFNRILKHYVGSHNFHNFTTRTKAEDPAAQRYIISFNANTVFNVEGIDFVKCEAVGQSFLLHQIRKMIGLAVAVMRNCTPESLMETALQKDVNINVSTAPEVGLYLDECLFASYNQKWKDSYEELSMKAYEEEAENFKMKQIYSHISLTEQKEGIVALWLQSLYYRNYLDLRAVNNDMVADKQRLEVRVVNNDEASDEKSSYGKEMVE